MKNIGVTLVLLFGLARLASAQVSVEVLMSQEQFLPNEAVPVKVRMVNSSGQTLTFGKDDWIRYSVEMRDGTIVLKTGEPPVPHNFTVKSAEMATARADLSPYFDITKSGGYAVTATVHIKAWGNDFTSDPAYFNVVAGVKFWEQNFGLPQSGKGEPEVRKYILQEAVLLKRMNLYVRVTDAAESKTYRVQSLGPTISFSNPQMLLDSKSNLHLLYQEASHRYRYTIINPDGEITTRQTYGTITSAPRLKMDDAGAPTIMGGLREVADNDLPSSRPSLTNVTPPPAP